MKIIKKFARAKNVLAKGFKSDKNTNLSPI